LEYLNCKPASTLREIKPFDVKFFPNPVRGELTLELELEEANDVRVQVYNISGGYQLEQEFSGEAGNNRFGVDFSSLTNGIYIIQVQSGKYQYAGKVIKL
jgi:lysyl endopeptidase